MESRKLISSGPSSLIISLPNQWIKENSLQKGMSVDLEHVQNGLLIRTKEATKSQAKEKSYTLKNKEQYLIREELIYCFLHNVDCINVPLKLVKNVSPVLDNIPGAELKIDKDNAYINNYLDKRRVNPSSEVSHCLRSMKDVLSKISKIKNEENVFEVDNILKNLERRLLIAESVVNKWIENPQERVQSGLKYVEITRLKLFLRELPRLLSHQMRLARKMTYLKGKKAQTLFKEIEEYFKPEIEEQNVEKFTKEKLTI
ncbi:MAG: hypothetical protein KKA62_01490, partial [Nanoarchaeota archaeon]|nr:hypothetical protein [Nanoarchaeota archaeon]